LIGYVQDCQNGPFSPSRYVPERQTAERPLPGYVQAWPKLRFSPTACPPDWQRAGCWRASTAGSLRDGTYRLTIRADKIHDAVGRLLDGYQVCEKWLKDRQGRTLTAADIAHYHKIVVALAETIRLMGKTDLQSV